jgi:hypothetical protein
MTVLVAVLTTLLAAAPPQATSTVSIPQAPPRDTSATTKGTGVIKGKVVTADGGRPLRRVQISISASELGEARTVSTNAQGAYEVTELPAGRYTLAATRAGYLRLQYGQSRPGESGRPLPLADGQTIGDINFALPRTSALVGRVTDEVGDPLPNASIFPMQWKYFRGERRLVPVAGGGPFNRTDETGLYRITGLEPGEYSVMATSRESWTDEKDPREKIGFLPTLSGGTASPVEALRLKVDLGQEALVPDFAMVPGRVGTISGTAISLSGLPLAGEQISMSQEFSGPGSSSSFGAAGTKIAADGSFTIRNVVPGEYKLSLRTPGDATRPPEGTAMVISFLGDDLAGVTLMTTPGATLRGRVLTDSGEPLPGDHKMRVSARPVDPTRTFSSFDRDNGTVRDDLTFELKDVFGANRLTVLPAPSGWAVRSIEYQGKDLVDVPLEVAGGQQIEGITVLLSKTMPTLNGMLLDDRGLPIAGAVVMFPEDQERWSEQSRLVRSTRPDDQGTFEFRNVVPGSYFVAPLEYVRQDDWADPAFLEGLRDRATRVSVGDDGAPPVALRLKASS